MRHFHGRRLCLHSKVATTFRGVSGKTYNSDNQKSNAGFSYDSNGNPTTYSSASLTFDVHDRLTAIGSTFSATYGADGQRASSVANGTATYYLYDGDSTSPVCEMNSSGTVIATNTYGLAGLVSRNTSSGSTFYEFDPQGTVVQRLNSAGGNTITSTADAFGAVVNSGTVSDPFGYEAQQGYYTDQSTGLLLTTFRYYDPGTGRFLNRDPLSYAGGMNLYGYCGNGPLAGTDPLGLDDDPFNNATGFFAGMGNTLTGGLTQGISNAIGQGLGLGNTDDMVDRCSSWYTGGQIAGAGLGLAMGDGEGVEAGVVEDLGEEGGVLCEGGCFVAGTQVQMADGSTKSIDKIKVGDEVKSRDPATGKDKVEPVLRLYIHPAPQIMELHLSDGEVITCNYSGRAIAS